MAVQHVYWAKRFALERTHTMCRSTPQSRLARAHFSSGSPGGSNDAHGLFTFFKDGLRHTSTSLDFPWRITHKSRFQNWICRSREHCRVNTAGSVPTPLIWIRRPGQALLMDLSDPRPM